MKLYTWKGVVYKNKAPNPLILDDGTSISPVSDADFEAAGGVITTNSDPTPEEEAHAAWKQFRKSVYAIQKFIHDPTFMGGFDEDYKLRESPYTKADKLTALELEAEWTGANAKAVYRSAIIGLGQPAWYFECWKHTDEDDPEEEE